MKFLITLLVSIILATNIYSQPNPKGNANGHNDPNNPNYDNPVPISGIEFLIIGGLGLGLYSIYRKKIISDGK